MEPLRIFYDPGWMPEDESACPVLLPFVERPYDGGYFDFLAQEELAQARQYMQITSFQDCECVALPFRWRTDATEFIGRIAKLANDHGKIFVVFYTHDIDYRFNYDNSLIFKGPAIFQSSRKTNEYAYSWTMKDYTRLYFNNNLPIRKAKAAPPIVAFAGDSYAQYPGQQIRNQVLAALILSSFVRTNFILRPGFSGLVQGDQRELLYREMIRNMLDGDYCLSVRGAGNASMRFYEACSLGRIPIFVDTDCVLPFDEEVNWRKHMIWVESHEIPYMGEKIAEWNHSCSNEEYVAMQINIRKLWNEYFSFCGFCNNFVKLVKKKIITEKSGIPTDLRK